MPLYTYLVAYKGETYVSQLSRSNFKGFVGTVIDSIPPSAFGGIDSRTKKEMTKICYGLNSKLNQTNVWEASGDVGGEKFLARIRTVAFEGVDVRPVDAQVQVSGGMPAFTKVRAITSEELDAAA